MSSSKHEGGKLLSSRILSSRDLSSSAVAKANASFRVYYSLGAGTVPFVWETKPGTPKSSVVSAADATTHYDEPPLPKISPPPSRTRKTYTRRAPSVSGPSRWGWMTRWLDVGRLMPSTEGGRWHAPDGAVDEGERQRRARGRAPILLCSCASDQLDLDRHG